MKFFLSNADGVPHSSVKVVAGHTWVSLQGGFDRLPAEAAEFKERVSPQSEGGLTDECGLFLRMEWSRAADWHNLDRDWLAWIPVIESRGESAAWYFMTYAHLDCSREGFNNFIIPDALRSTIEADLLLAWGVVDEIRHSYAFPQRAPSPSEFDCAAFSFAKATTKGITDLLMSACRKMLELLGFINWWSRTHGGWRYSVYEGMKWSSTAGEDFDPFTDGFEETASGLLLFQYDEFLEEIEGPLPLTHLPGDLFHASWEYYLVGHRGWGRKEVNIWTMRQFCAKNYSFTLRVDQASKQTIVTFYAYRPAAPNDLAVEKSENPYRLPESGSDGDGDGISIPEDDENDVPDVVDVVDERERNRTIYAPRPGQEYDETTGIERVAAFAGHTGRARYTLVMNRRLPEDQAHSRAQLAVADAVKVMRDFVYISDVTPSPHAPKDARDLMNRLQLRPAVAGAPSRSPPTGPRLGRRGGKTSPVGGRSLESRSDYRPGSSASSRRSASPPPRTGSSIGSRRPSPLRSALRRPNAEQSAWITAWVASDAGTRISDNSFPFVIPAQCQWSQLFLDKAVLVVTDVPSLVRLRFWACTQGPFHDFKDILNLAIKKGLTFKLAVRKQDITAFNPQSLPDEQRVMEAKDYDTNADEPPLEWNGGGLAFARTWEKRVFGILSKGKARCLIGAGGSLGYLARRLFPRTLIAGFMSGPSSQVTVHHRGWSDSGDSVSLGLLCDEMSASELGILLGFFKGSQPDTNSWILPPTDILWELSHYYSGELNDGWTDSLDIIMDEVSAGEPVQRTRGGFRDHFRKGQRGLRKPTLDRLLKPDFKEEEKLLKDTFSDNWSKAQVRGIRIPGSWRSVTAA
ncbi:hypothetical protein C8R46DRAFT_1043212 [Mycena filopes]|nr:hypothetical protein C8R46DRAFT_1043212 [Mycena filopes]